MNSICKRSARVAIIFAALGASTAFGIDAPVRIDPQEASGNLVKKVEPQLPQMAKLGGIGGKVLVDATISSEGKVVSLKAISGHPILVQAVLDAVRQWEYKPFIREGRAITAVTRVEWSFPSAVYTKSEEAAQRDYYPAFESCYKLVRAQKYAESEAKCSEAVRISDRLSPQRLIERSSSRTFLGHSLLNQGKIAASIPMYEKAVQIRATVEGSDHDADFAWDNANLARAYFLAGEGEKADPLYARAVIIFEAAIKALPEMKSHYAEGLKTTLLEYAKLKSAQGEAEEARKLEERAAALK